MSAMNAQEPEQFTGPGRVRLLRRRGKPRVTLRQRMRSDQFRKGVYLIPSLFTAANLMCGFFSIIATFRGEYVNAALLILLANVFDGVDGYVARLTRTTSQFGVEFDSLADVVAFGVAPAVLVYLWALAPWDNWGWLAASTYVVCGALRLSRFNVQAQGAVKNHFVGLPIPAAAQAITSSVILYYHMGFEGTPTRHLTFLLVTYGLALLMVSNIPYFSLKNNDMRKRHPEWMFLSGLILITLIIAERHVMFFTIVLLYTLSGPLLWCLITLKHRRELRREAAKVLP
jgi:CDP-diacylglycerol--serine O-phosphatidyltransferase